MKTWSSVLTQIGQNHRQPYFAWMVVGGFLYTISRVKLCSHKLLTLFGVVWFSSARMQVPGAVSGENLENMNGIRSRFLTQGEPLVVS